MNAAAALKEPEVTAAAPRRRYTVRRGHGPRKVPAVRREVTFVQFRDVASGRFAAKPAAPDAPPALGTERTFVQYKGPISGQFENRPPPAPGAPLARVALRARPRRAKSDTLAIRKLLDWGDGETEVIAVRVIFPPGRAARRAGELSAQALRDLENDLSLCALQEINPTRAREYELAEMHAAHNADKGKRSAVSRRRNAAARALDESKGIRVRSRKR